MLDLVSVSSDCDDDLLLVLVNFNGLICYIGVESCWFDGDVVDYIFVGDLEWVLVVCKLVDLELSYIVKLYSKGVKCIVQKVGEEGVEIVLVVIVMDKEELCNEVVDLFYYLIVLLQVCDMLVLDVVNVFRECYKG